MRVFSFAQESTRYCNYSKDKFGNELTFIIPSWLDIDEGRYSHDEDTVDGISIWGYKDDHTVVLSEWISGKGNSQQQEFMAYLDNVEWSYMKLLENGNTPQQARQILPNALKTELVMTGFVSDWQHFFDLRARGTTGAPHPDAKALAEPLMHEFESKNLI